MEETEKIYNRATAWYVINLKARTRQTATHYVDAIRQVKEQDPLIEVYGKKCISIRSMEECNILDAEGVPQWIRLTIIHYTIVDPSAFYNIRERRDVKMDWDKDIVANKKEAELLIIPSVHKVVVKKSTNISLNNIVAYLDGALNRVEEETFDVTVVVDREFIQRIVSAYSIISFSAQISFSNPGHSEGFSHIFEDKVRDMNPDSFSVSAKGTSKNPLNNSEDGLIQAACALAEQNGTVTARIQETEMSRPITVDSKEHPFVLKLTYFVNDLYSTLCNEMKTLFSRTNG